MNGKTKYADHGIEAPHDHDVLSGRGNFVNYHTGNEYFRGLVRKHKVAYVACPKPQKGKFSRMIVDDIAMREPPGRFLKQDGATKLWYDIGDKKALDKTRQALREGAPEILKEFDPEDEEDDEELGPTSHLVQPRFGGPSGFGAGDTTNFPSSLGQHRMGMVLDMASPSNVHSSGLMQLGGASQMQINRIVPGVNIPAGTTQLGSLREPGGFNALASAIQAQQTGLYEAEQFEPTPMNPHAHIRMATEDRPAPAPQSRGIQRDDSLTFEHLFAKDQPTHGKATKQKDSLSQHLSGMSFSIGDMTDTSNLSAVFEDSMRISDDPPAPSYAKFESIRKMPAAASSYASEAGKKKSTPNVEMSASSYGSLGLESSMMHISFKSGSGYDDDSTRDGR